MELHDASGAEDRFRSYSADLASSLGHADRVRPFTDYCVGLLSAEGRKSVERSEERRVGKECRL